MNPAALELARAGAAPAPIAAAHGDIDAAARDFEAVFIAQMFDQMFADLPTDGPGGGGSGERIFRSLMVEAIGRQMAAQGGMGLGAMVRRELIALQEAGRK